MTNDSMREAAEALLAELGAPSTGDAQVSKASPPNAAMFGICPFGHPLSSFRTVRRIMDHGQPRYEVDLSLCCTGCGNDGGWTNADLEAAER